MFGSLRIGATTVPTAGGGRQREEPTYDSASRMRSQSLRARKVPDEKTVHSCVSPRHTSTEAVVVDGKPSKLRGATQANET